MKKAFILLFATALIYSCNSGGDAKKEETNTADTSKAATPPAADAGLPNEKGLELIGASDCTTCHAIDRKIIGPAYNDVAKKYASADASIVDTLVHKVKVGGVGVWGNIPMTPHPTVPDADIREMVKYILTLKNQ
jgi:cytochrome c